MNKIGQVLQKKETILQIYLQCSAEKVCSVNNAVSIKMNVVNLSTVPTISN